MEIYENSIWSSFQWTKLFFDLLNLNKHFWRNFSSTAFLKNPVQNRCLILLFTIWGTFSLAIILPAKPPNSYMQSSKYLTFTQSVTNIYIFIPQFVYVVILKGHEQTTRDSSLCISSFQSLLSECVKTTTTCWLEYTISKVNLKG